MFLLQKPYTVFGTLRDQMLYGLHDLRISDDRLREVIEALKLVPVVMRVGGLDAHAIGRQRCRSASNICSLLPDCCWRILRFAFLDQAINSLGPHRGKQLYQLLTDTSITFLTVGDHSHIQPYHDLVSNCTKMDAGKPIPPEGAQSA